MKSIDVYAVGNALVDYEFEVSVAELERLGISKGVMTLIEESRHDELVGELQGEKHKRACGGSAANSLIAISQLGGKAFLSCKVAQDEAGDFYTADLRQNNIQTNLANDGRDEGKTGKCLVMITPDADRTMNTFLGITADVGPAELEEKALADCQYLYIEGYLASSPSAREAVRLAKKQVSKAGGKIAVSLSDPNMIKFFRDGIAEFVDGSIDMLFCNEAEAIAFTGAKGAFQAVDALKDLSVGFAITRGAHGALVWDGDKLYEVPADPVNVVDTLGAGDMFAGAFLYGLCRGWNFRQAAELGNYAAGMVVSAFGPRLLPQYLTALRDRAKAIGKGR